MIKILIADDDNFKAIQLSELLDKFPEASYDVASDVNSAKSYLVNEQYDLLILDLCIPNRFGQDASADNGINFLLAIENTQRIIKPYHIIGLTAFDNLINEYAQKFVDHLWILIHFQLNSSHWEHQIRVKINYLINSKQSIQQSVNNHFLYDLAIITALREPELSQVLKLTVWEDFKVINDPTTYYRGIFSNSTKSIRVVAASATQMGMVATTFLSTKMISHFRPKYIAMTGIAGGIESKGNLGDIIIAESAFDYGSGKIKTDAQDNSKFEPDFRPLEISPELKEEFGVCKAERSYLDAIRNEWVGAKPSTPLDLIIGPLGSGAGVVEYKGLIENIKEHSRKLVGIDMETYGLYYSAANCVQPRPLGVMSIKSISDFANKDKGDDFQMYSAFTSCRFLYHFALNRLKFD